MSIHKTPQHKRNAIRYEFYDADGHREPTITIYPGKDGITELDIQNFYRLEDSEVYHNIRATNPNSWLTEADRKALRVQKDAFAQKYISDFRTRYGYEPCAADVTDAVNEAFPKNWTASLDAMVDGADDDGYGDKSSVLFDIAAPDADDVPDYIDRLREIVAAFPEKWQTIYQRVLLAGESKTEVGAALGISDVRVGQIVRQIQKKIAADEILQKFF